MTPEPGDELPLSHPLKVEAIKLRGTHVTVEAKGEALAAIAREMGLASVEALKARYELSRNGERVKLEGSIVAAFHQTCIVSLDPFPVELTVPMKLDFLPEVETQAIAARAEKADQGGEVDIELRLNEDDPPEPIVDGVIDLGAVTLEFLALALDPYPRKPGAAFDASLGGAEPESPFAVLARLKPGS